MDSFGKRLKAARKNAKSTAAHLADRLGVSTATIYGWEGDSSAPNKENLKKLEKMFGPLSPESTAKKKRKRRRAPPPSSFRIKDIQAPTDPDTLSTGQAANFEFARVVAAVLRSSVTADVVQLLRVARDHGLSLNGLLKLLGAE